MCLRLSTRTMPLEPGTQDLGSQEMTSSPSIASWFKDPAKLECRAISSVGCSRNWWDVAEAGRKNERPEPLACVPGVHCPHRGVQGTHKCTHKSPAELPHPCLCILNCLLVPYQYAPNRKPPLGQKEAPKEKRNKFFWLFWGLFFRVN